MLQASASAVIDVSRMFRFIGECRANILCIYHECIYSNETEESQRVPEMLMKSPTSFGH